MEMSEDELKFLESICANDEVDSLVNIMEQSGEKIPPNEIKNMKIICKLIKKKTEKKEKKETMTEMNYIPIPIDSIGIKFYGASENPDKPLRRNKVLEAVAPPSVLSPSPSAINTRSPPDSMVESFAVIKEGLVNEQFQPGLTPSGRFMMGGTPFVI